MSIRSAHLFLVALLLSVVSALPVVAEIACAKDTNQPPRAADDFFPIWPATGVSTPLPLLANDEDPEGQALTIVSVTPPGAAGTATLSGGVVSFTAANGHSGAQFQYTVRDPAGATATATVRIGTGVAQTSTIAITCAFDWCNFTPVPYPPSEVRSYSWRIFRLNGSAAELLHERPNWTGSAYRHQMPGVGTYRVDLTVNYQNGAGVPVSRQFAVAAPVVQATLDRIDAGDSLELKTLLTVNIAPTSGKTLFVWGDGKQDELPWTDLDHTGTNGTYRKDVWHLYENPGIYHVRVVVTPNGATSSAFEYTYDIRNKPPRAVIDEFGAANSSDEWPLDTSLFEWSWGDGSYTYGETNPVHDYAEPGTYIMTLTVTDRHGATGSLTRTVEVENDPPVAALSVQCFGRACSLNAAASTDDGRIDRYTWTVPGLPAWSTDSPRTTFSAPADGRYPVQVSVSDGSLAGTASRVVHVRSSAPSGLAFYAIAPCRAFDSRSATRLAAGVAQRINVGTPCAVPADARAVEANFIAVAPDGAGHVRAWAAGTATPETSVLNYGAGTVIGNNTAVRLNIVNDSVRSNVGVINVSSSTGTHLIVDVTGYYAAVNAPYQPTSVGPLWMHRAYMDLYDTTEVDSPLASGTTRSVPLSVIPSYSGSIPPKERMRALFAVVDVLSATAPGHVELFSLGAAPPPTSAVNFSTPRIIANQAIVKTASGGLDGLSIRYIGGGSNTAHVAVKSNAAFVDAAYKQHSQRYYPIEPCRALDTRDQAYGYELTQRDTLRILAAGNCGIPAHVTAVRVNVTAINSYDPALGSLYSVRPFMRTVGNELIAGGTIGFIDSGYFNRPGELNLAFLTPVSHYFMPVHVVVDFVGYYAADPADQTP